jgi:hypothetical protein
MLFGWDALALLLVVVTKSHLQVESSSGTSKEPTKVIDASSLDVT